MALHTQIQVTIDEELIPVIDNFSLIENVGNHASFSISIEGEHSENENSSTILERTKAYLGKPCLVRISEHEGNSNTGPLEFKGIVTNLEGYRDNNHGQIKEMIVISGKSSSIILDGSPDFTSYTEETLSAVVQNAVGVFDQSLLNLNVSPENDPSLLYTVQNNLSKFNYLKYLAAVNGEYFIYAKDTLYFGKPDLGDTVELNLGNTLENVSIGLKTLPTKVNYFSNDYINEASVTSNTSDNPHTSNSGYVGFTNGVNDNFYPEPTQIAYSTFEDSAMQQRLTTAVALQKKINEQDQISLTGTSYLPSVSLGKIISVQNNGEHYGTYRVVSIKHNCTNVGNYKNTFTAIPIEIDVYPLTNINNYNKSGSQIATVFDNVDPEGMSRIKVQFPWQVLTNTTTPWIRVMTPHSGLDKGFHFIHEIGEKVIIGFENNNVESPYVLGALYTGINKPEEWQTDANNVKAIRTRSGHTIELNDTEGEEMIKIYDNEGSIIEFNTQEKSLTINATETIDIAAKNINITAEENITIGAQQNVEIAAEADLSAIAQGNVNVQSTGDTGVKSSGAIAIEATTDATLQGMNAIIEGQTGAELNGAQTKISGSAMAEVSGAVVKIN